jgi:hypothetical protein
MGETGRVPERLAQGASNREHPYYFFEAHRKLTLPPKLDELAKLAI